MLTKKLHLLYSILLLAWVLLTASCGWYETKPDPKFNRNISPTNISTTATNGQNKLNTAISYGVLPVDNRFTLPEKRGDMVYTVYIYQLTPSDSQGRMKIILTGFSYLLEYSHYGDMIAVGIAFTDNSQAVYYCKREDYQSLQSQNISTETFVGQKLRIKKS